jgi:hypothetical protein
MEPTATTRKDIVEMTRASLARRTKKVINRRGDVEFRPRPTNRPSSLDHMGSSTWKSRTEHHHRAGGPAALGPDGHQQWWVNNGHQRNATPPGRDDWDWFRGRLWPG